MRNRRRPEVTLASEAPEERAETLARAETIVTDARGSISADVVGRPGGAGVAGAPSCQRRRSRQSLTCAAGRPSDTGLTDTELRPAVRSCQQVQLIEV